MGFFSWKTQDTNRSIANCYSNREPFEVTMVDEQGTRWTEHNYEGYGIFNGKDFYQLVAEMNGLGHDRDAGITLAHSGKDYISPNLNEDPDIDWSDTKPESCEDQGYFYPDENCMTKEDILIAIKNGVPLVWDDPDPIEGNDYTIKNVFDVAEETAVIQYGSGPDYSEAQVFLIEIKLK